MCNLLQKVLEHKNHHEAFGAKSDPPVNDKDEEVTALQLDSQLDMVPEDCNEKPPRATLNASQEDLESSVEELDVEELIAVRKAYARRDVLISYKRNIFLTDIFRK